MVVDKVIQSVSFSGHESFPLRFAWLTKAVRGVHEDPALFGRDDATVALGVGKNMVRSIRHWALRTGVIQPIGNDRRGGRYQSTDLGKFLFSDSGADPYLEDIATVWLIHWLLSSHFKHSPTTWYWIFNELRQSSFSQQEIVDQLLKTAEGVSGKMPSRATIARDFACFIRTYLPIEPDRRLSQEETYDSPLTELRLLRREPESGRLVLERNSRHGLPPHVFAYGACVFWNTVAPHSDTLSFEQVTYQPGSPGQVFRLTENACVDYLESLYFLTDGAIGFDRTASVRQLIKHRNLLNPFTILSRYYKEVGVGSNA